jgi:phytoene desaturase
MHQSPCVVVIGAGVGGIAAAARLAQLGCTVTVLEKHPAPGGRCGQIVRDGHRFDIGPTLLLMPELFRATYAALSERLEDHLHLRRIDPTYHIHFDDGSQLALTGDLEALKPQLEAIEPGSFAALLRFLAEGDRHYRLSLRHFVGRDWSSLAEYLSPRNMLRIVFELHALRRHYSALGDYFHDPRLRAAFSFQNMYLGLSPFDAPATYSLLQYTELADGVWFPQGGLYSVVESLTQIAEAAGVRFVYGAPVDQIEVDGERARGVRLQNGSRMTADVVVANADLPYVYSQLLPDRTAARRLDGLEHTCSAFTFYWGVDRVYPQLGTHNVFLAGEYRASFDRIFRDHTLPDDPSVYVHAPARADASAAPAGQDTVMALVPVGHLGAHRDWEMLRARARAAVLRRLAQVGISDLEQHLKFEVCYAPKTWAGLYNLSRGSAFGLSHGVWQVGYLRPRNRHARCRNLYFVGASTHPGGGLPMVLESARLTTERIQADLQIPAPVVNRRGARRPIAVAL